MLTSVTLTPSVSLVAVKCATFLFISDTEVEYSLIISLYCMHTAVYCKKIRTEVSEETQADKLNHILGRANSCQQ